MPSDDRSLIPSWRQIEGYELALQRELAERLRKVENIEERGGHAAYERGVCFGLDRAINRIGNLLKER